MAQPKRGRMRRPCRGPCGRMNAFQKPGGAIFDCDGVLLDSNRIKSEGFRSALAEEPAEQVERFFAYLHANAGLMRDALFEHYFRSIAPRTDWASPVADAIRVFGKHTMESLLACAQIPGAAELVQTLSDAGVPCVVVSAARPDDLELILSEKGMQYLFAAVRGGDRTKIAHIASLIDEGTVRAPLVYFGDSRVDMEAAEAFGARFVFVSAGTDWMDGEAVCGARGHTVVTDLRDFD